MRYRTKTIHVTFVAATFATLLSVPTTTLADSVQLHSYDGSVHVTGEFLGYDKTGFTIDTPLGPLLFASALVRCEGAVCPPVEQVQADLQAAGYTLPEHTPSNSQALNQKPHFCPHHANPLDLNINS